MTRHQFDLFVIGAGSGGVRAARFAAQYGARVAIAEDTFMGGTCVNVGCVPKKLFMYAAHFHEVFGDAAGFGWEMGGAKFDWRRLLDNKDAEIRRLNAIYAKLLDTSGATIFNGHASLIDAHTVRVGDDIVTAKYILIATGCTPWVPAVPGREHVITSNDIFHLERLPRRIAIIGGGYIALEFASILNGMGVEVSLIYRGELPLRGFDSEMREHLIAELKKKGVATFFNRDVVRIERDGDALRVVTAAGDIVGDSVLYATGRRPRTQALGLEAVGVRCDDNGFIIADAHFRTSVPNIFAIGDVIGGLELTPMALAQGMAVAKTLFRAQPTSVDTELIPTAVFTQPSFATVGLGEEAARERYGDIAVFTAKFTQLKHTLTDNDEKTLMKLVVDKVTDRVVGAHMVGPDAGEIIQGIAVALRAGATKADFDSTLGIHPSAAEEFVTMRTAAR